MYRKFLICLTILLLVIFTSYGQLKHNLEISLGTNLTIFRAKNTTGATVFFPDRTISNFQNSKENIGLSWGFQYELILFKRLSIVTGYVFNSHDFDTEVLYDSITSIGIEKLDHNWEFRSRSIPFKIGYKIGNKFSMTPRIGLQHSKLLDFRRSGNFIRGIEPEEYFATHHLGEEVFSNQDIAWLVELEVSYPIASKVIIDTKISFIQSLIDINMEFNPDDPPIIKIETVNLSFGIKYPISK